MKQYTTPTIEITVKDVGDVKAADFLASADDVILTVSDGTLDINKDGVINGNKVSAELTEAETASLSIGTLQVELTFSIGEKVFKTKTMKLKMLEAVRDEVM